MVIRACGGFSVSVEALDPLWQRIEGVPDGCDNCEGPAGIMRSEQQRRLELRPEDPMLSSSPTFDLASVYATAHGASYRTFEGSTASAPYTMKKGVYVSIYLVWYVGSIELMAIL